MVHILVLLLLLKLEGLGLVERLLEACGVGRLVWVVGLHLLIGVVRGKEVTVADLGMLDLVGVGSRGRLT